MNKDRGMFLSSILGVRLVEDFGAYLGLPSCFSLVVIMTVGLSLKKLARSFKVGNKNFSQ